MKEVKPSRKFKGKTPLIKSKNKLWNKLRTYIFNKYNFKCYTCDQVNLKGSNLQLGHYHTAGNCGSDMFFSVNNLRPQCLRCNQQLNGNTIKFRFNLIDELGQEMVDQLDHFVLYEDRIKPWKKDRLEEESIKIDSMIAKLD